MKIVLGEKSDDNLAFAEKIKGILADEICGIKNIKNNIDLYIINKLLDNGFIEGTNIYLEEILLVMKINKIYYNFPITKYLSELIEIYHLEIYTDFSV